LKKNTKNSHNISIITSVRWFGGQNSKEFLVSIDGEIDDEDYSVDFKKAADKVINQHGKAFEKLAESEE